jgi:thiamine pyrophosphokinase
MYPHERHSRLFNAKKNNTDFSMCLFFWSKKALVSSIGIVVVGKSIKEKSIQILIVCTQQAFDNLLCFAQ